ncbi:MAG TPA: tetraacyldisaccharide 4'-kinase [Porticoccaceae bacterium]|nr:tetraacyldisaccharide 4'-kinase [Porticoccaceae bacterium]
MSRLLQAWYRPESWTRLFSPLAWMFCGIATSRRRRLQAEYQGKPFAVPLVVVGNIAVGGTGKTPLLIGLVRQLRAEGIAPGIVSRGYGGTAGATPLVVHSDSAVEACGDEALLIARETACPTVVCSDRRAAVQHLLASFAVDVILSDDGMQHYRLHRDMEIAVVDARRGLGNGLCLPAGPLREPPSRLLEVDAVVINGTAPAGGFSSLAELGTPESTVFEMTLRPLRFTHLASGEQVACDAWALARNVHAVAGIGNPARFRDTLVQLGLAPQLHAFADHHRFSSRDLAFDDDLPIIMTAKDAVKCESWADARCWRLDVEADIDPILAKNIVNLIN